MTMFYFGPTVVIDSTTGRAAEDGRPLLFWNDPNRLSPLQPYDAGGTPTTVTTQGGLAPGLNFDLPSEQEVYYDGGAGLFPVYPSNFAEATVKAAQSAVTTVTSFESRVSLLEAKVAAGGTGGGGSQLGIVEDVFTLAAADGSSLVGAGGALVFRTSFTYATVPTGHRLVIKDHPDYSGSTVQPLLPAAFWGEASKTNPQAEFISNRTPVNG